MKSFLIWTNVPAMIIAGILYDWYGMSGIVMGIILLVVSYFIWDKFNNSGR